MVTSGETILWILGGEQFVLITGARGITCENNRLAFRLPSTMTKQHIGAVDIKATPSGTFTVEFATIRKMRATLVSRHEEVYVEQLRPLFIGTTGLETRR